MSTLAQDPQWRINIAPSALQTALQLAEYGLPVFPCRPDKKPYIAGGFKNASRDPQQIRWWWIRWPDALIGVPTGRASGLLVVDIDPDGMPWYREQRDELKCMLVHYTRRDGRHLLYRVPDGEDIGCSVSKIAPGVDVRAEGGYIIWWPAHGCESIGDLRYLSEPPSWLLELLKRRPNGHEPGGDKQLDAGAVIAEGGRNDYLSREAYRLRKQGANCEQILTTLHGLNQARCSPPLDDAELKRIADGKERILPDTVTLGDFYAYLPAHQYLYVPTRELWPAASINALIRSDSGVKASTRLDQQRGIRQMTWAPGRPMVIEDKLIDTGGWTDEPGARCFNLYRAPAPIAGNPDQAGPWIEHARRVYPDDFEHIIRWLAHRVQQPGKKLNHALVLGGSQGIGKDTLLEPAKYAVGPWNFLEVSPMHLLAPYNGFVKSVILRVSEARDLGDVDRYKFYEHMKVYTAAPPDVLRCNEKFLREHAVLNICGVIITTNYKTDGIYVPADDRRHYVAWSTLTKEDFSSDYWRELWGWYEAGGIGHVAAYLAQVDLTNFDPKAPPPHTATWHDIVSANRAPQDAELADVIDHLGLPEALTIEQIATAAGAVRADGEFVAGTLSGWIIDAKNRRQIPHRLELVGYTPVRNAAAKTDGLWMLKGRRQAIYARKTLSEAARITAAQELIKRSAHLRRSV